MEARTLPCFRSSHHSRGKHHDTSYQPEDAVNGYAKEPKWKEKKPYERVEDQRQ